MAADELTLLQARMELRSHGALFAADAETDKADEAGSVESVALSAADDNSNATAVPKGAVIAPFGKEDTATELQKHAARTQDTLVDAVENAEVAEIKRSVFRALTRLRAAEIKEFARTNTCGLHPNDFSRALLKSC